MAINLADNKLEFESLVKKYIKREGIDKFMKWLEGTDFYTAPSTTQYSLSVEGGLCQHSLNVFHTMIDLVNDFYGKEVSPENVYNGDTIEAEGAFAMESIAIVALFHAVHKTGCYVRDFRNVKEGGRWVQKEYWRWQEQFVYGRGSKSVYILQQFMRLYVDEAQAIRFYAGGREDVLSGQFESLYMPVYEKSPLAVFLFLASEAATWLIREE